jgi:uncharacterized membrane protein SpoIIM required for sporulation
MLCDKADATPKALNSKELKEIIHLYRQASGDLALARTQSGNLQLVEFLNDLVGRAYITIYRPTRGSFFKAIGEGIQRYAAVARRRKVFIFAAAATLLLGSLFSSILMTTRPELRERFVAPQMEENFKHWRNGLEQRTGEQSAMMTGFYMDNNSRVTIITTSVSAATFGLLTVYLLWQNGLVLGALAADMNEVGKLDYLLAYISPHGVTEIQGIFIGGGAGYLMGWTLFFPGRRRRGDALRDAAKDALVLLCGGVVLMYLAAPFEGFFSFDPRIPQPLKFTVAALIAGGWFLFYRGVGRHFDEPQLQPPSH